MNSLFLIALFCSAVAFGESTDAPVIGVLAQGTYGHFAEFGRMYIAASYVKFLEAGGARVVPVLNNLTESQVTELFSSLNGVLLPGGGANLTDSGYSRNSQLFLKLTLEAAKKGDIFPLWGTCRGMEELLTLQAGQGVMDFFDAKNDSLPLSFSSGFEKTRLLGECPADVLSWLQSENLTMNYHRLGISPEKFQGTAAISDFYDMLATSVDRKGKLFVSAMEAKDYPIYATIFHPEKSMFEWRSTLAINHSPHAVKAAQYFADFFVGETRKSTHEFTNFTSLIYNFSPVYTGSFHSLYEQCYFF